MLKFQIYYPCRLIFCVVFIFWGAAILTAQTPTPTPSCDFKDYSQLDAERSNAQKQITEQDNRIKVLKDKISDLESFETELAEVDKQIKELKDKTDKTEEEKEELKRLVDYRPVTEGRIKGLNEGRTTAELKEELKQQELSYPTTRAKLQCIDQTLRKWLSPEGNFKFWMSFIFAILIALVIGGFFWTALIDDKVRQAVFAGQVGLQFIALFSIVIAIILFGITGILEAKELAALLGSLAGYILGRTMSNRSSETGGDRGPGGNSFPSRVAAIEVNPVDLNLDLNKPSEKLTVTLFDASGKALTPPAGTSKPSWKSSDTSVATVDGNGVVTRVATGTATITADFNGRTASCSVNCV
jgi:uncharacterized protein YjdB